MKIEKKKFCLELIDKVLFYLFIFLNKDDSEWLLL